VRNAYNILVGKPEGKRPLGIPRQDDNIRRDSREMGCEGVDWIHLLQERAAAGPCEHSKEPFGSIKGGKCLDYLGDC
jgi:hypothetical protein